MPEQAFKKLNHDPNDQQFRRSILFLEGLQAILDMWGKKFWINCKGLSQPYWHEYDSSKNVHYLYGTQNEVTDSYLKMQALVEEGLHITKNGFLAACKTLQGSRDLGAQLFCALLRSAGVTCRLVCSLQVLPFSFSVKMDTPRIGGTPDAMDTSNDARSSSRSRFSLLRRPHLHETPTPKLTLNPPTEHNKSNTAESAYPVYWVEAWSAPAQKWIPVDPHGTATVGKPGRLEPPAADRNNSMAYVVAFESGSCIITVLMLAVSHSGIGGQARDVTRRYAKSYNGKTRRLRVSSIKGGQKWWESVLGVFQRGYRLVSLSKTTANILH